MKKTIFAAAAFLLVAGVSFAGKVVAPSALPGKVTAFVAQHFPESEIVFAEADYDEYEVQLDDRTEITFTRGGDWKEVECWNGVPSAILPESVLSVAGEKYPDETIVKAEKKRKGYELKLSNRMELYFSPNGKFLGAKHD
ncbi:MAG: PepSY-like domain-containing protein [Treponemataceae bacterium]|nr:PepSY-like domain-containing protein [Treponemataceae bacterium]